MTKDDLIKKIHELSDNRFERVAPFIEADLEAGEDLRALHQAIEAGRQSAATQPILEAKDVYARIRRSLGR